MMNEFRNLSKLPEDPQYWEDLEARVMADLGSPVRGTAVEIPSWWSPLAVRAWGLGGLAAAVALAALLLAPGRSVPGSSAAGLLSLPEGDPVLEALVSAPAPPSLASLMLPENRSAR
jgi:hypothetical protein